MLIFSVYSATQHALSYFCVVLHVSLPSNQIVRLKINTRQKMKEKISNYNLKLVNQIFLFSNIWTSLIWVISSYYLLYYQVKIDSSTLKGFSAREIYCLPTHKVLCYHFQSEKHPNINFTLAGFCIVVSTFIEVVRIYTGYSGNINSDVSNKVQYFFFF